MSFGTEGEESKEEKDKEDKKEDDKETEKETKEEKKEGDEKVRGKVACFIVDASTRRAITHSAGQKVRRSPCPSPRPSFTHTPVAKLLRVRKKM